MMHRSMARSFSQHNHTVAANDGTDGTTNGTRLSCKSCARATSEALVDVGCFSGC